jgi:protein-tyrosine phosphatase
VLVFDTPNPVQVTRKVIILRTFICSMEKKAVLFVCLGNICRSPMAEAIFNHKIREQGLDHVLSADSCGTGNYHIGAQPDPRTIANARKNKVSIEHCARQLSLTDFDSFDYIMAMDHSNFQNINRLANSPAHRAKITLMRDFDPLHKGAEVPDPYFGGEEGFQEVFQILDRTMDNFIDHLVRTHSLR